MPLQQRAPPLRHRPDDPRDRPLRARRAPAGARPRLRRDARALRASRSHAPVPVAAWINKPESEGGCSL